MNFRDEMDPGAMGTLRCIMCPGVIWTLLEFAVYPPVGKGGVCPYEAVLAKDVEGCDCSPEALSKAGIPFKSSHQISEVRSISSVMPPETHRRPPHIQVEWSYLGTKRHGLDQVQVLRSK